MPPAVMNRNVAHQSSARKIQYAFNEYKVKKDRNAGLDTSIRLLQSKFRCKEAQKAKRRSQYERVKRVGKGSFATAYLVRDKSDGTMYVLKEVNVDSLSRRERADALQEAELMKRFNHPNVIKYADSFLDKSTLCIVMEYAEGGNLYEAMNRQKQRLFTEDQIWKWFAQMTSAVAYMHDFCVLHRDIKAENMFLSKDGNIKLGDFGISRALRSHKDMAHTRCGTPLNFSPEICQGKPYSMKSDVYALGALLYETAALKPAFDGKSLNQLLSNIMKGSYRPLPSQYSKDLTRLVDKCMSLRPEDRPRACDILKMPALVARVGNNPAANASSHHFINAVTGQQQQALTGAVTIGGGCHPKPMADIIAEEKAAEKERERDEKKSNLLAPVGAAATAAAERHALRQRQAAAAASDNNSSNVSGAVAHGRRRDSSENKENTNAAAAGGKSAAGGVGQAIGLNHHHHFGGGGAPPNHNHHATDITTGGAVPQGSSRDQYLQRQHEKITAMEVELKQIRSRRLAREKHSPTHGRRRGQQQQQPVATGVISNDFAGMGAGRQVVGGLGGQQQQQQRRDGAAAAIGGIAHGRRRGGAAGGAASDRSSGGSSSSGGSGGGGTRHGAVVGAAAPSAQLKSSFGRKLLEHYGDNPRRVFDRFKDRATAIGNFGDGQSRITPSSLVLLGRSLNIHLSNDSALQLVAYVSPADPSGIVYRDFIKLFGGSS